MALWTPADITTALWLDADDSSTVFSDAGITSATGGDTLQQWNDRSGNSLTAAQATSGARPLYETNQLNGKPGITFAAGDFMSSTGNSVGCLPVASSNIFIVYSQAVFGSNQGTFSTIPAAGSDFNQTDAYTISHGNNGTSYLANLNSGPYNVDNFPTTFSANITRFEVYAVGNASSGFVKLFRDGTLLSTDSDGNALAAFIGGDGYALSARASAGPTFNNSNGEQQFFEVIVTGPLDSIVQLRVEGYLAHKWGLEANLPADHPYKAYAPGSKVAELTTAYNTFITGAKSIPSGRVSLLLNCNGTNGSTTFTDSSSNNHTVTGAGNAQISTTQSKFGGASVSFDGNGDYLSATPDVGYAFGTADFTVEAWIYPTSFPNTYHTIAATRGISASTTAWSWSVVSDGTFILYTNGFAYTGTVTGAISLNTWSHVALCRSAGNLQIYANGIANNATPASLNNNFTDQNLWIGTTGGVATGGGVGGDPFTGYIDDFRITKGVALYKSNYTPPTSELTLVQEKLSLWDSIKTACVMAGWDGLDGALTVLKGTDVPTNNNFEEDDYSRTDGLKGDGSTKYLDSGRDNTDDPQDDKHLAIYLSEDRDTSSGFGAYIGSTWSSGTDGASHLGTDNGVYRFFRVNNTLVSSDNADRFAYDNAMTGFYGASRSISTDVDLRYNGVNVNSTDDSSTRDSGAITVFGRGGTDLSDPRIAFYSIGESLDLAALDTLITQLIADIAAALAPP